MPIYDATPEQHSQAEEQDNTPLQRSSTPGSGRTSPTLIFNPYYTGRPRTPVYGTKSTTVDRQEIIRRIKSREDRSRPTSPELERQERNVDSRQDEQEDKSELGLQIERPRSALHRGDFRDKETSISGFGTFATDVTTPLSISPPAPWHPSFASSTFRQAWQERRLTRPHEFAANKQRAASSAGLSQQFLYKLPTSPLVQSSRPDTPPLGAKRSSRSPDKRRHTFSPQALQRYASDLESGRRSNDAIVPTLRKERTFPYQAHQPRRSLHALQPPDISPATPLAIRRPSISSEAHSPLHHAPMVGSYEESILRGRMSTTPSKPLNFIAQIGVLGKGSCKASLRCPPHVAVPFPAVFYSYGAGSKQGNSDQPSPYVGLVDLENGLSNQDDTPGRRRQRLGERLQAAISDESRANSQTREDSSGADVPQRKRQNQKAKRRSGSPKAPPGGSYRIPQQGQLQIVIKNPNKTAVKLFLIPYDLSDMVPGQKTFIRQRSYSAGPIIDMPLTSRTNLGTDRPEASLTTSEDPNDRPMLRYLVHLHICCTGRGRYWLYKSIRLVFANRVPDGKEKLRNEIQLPEPRYSTYKPTRVSTMLESPAVAASQRSQEKISPIVWQPGPASLPTKHDVPDFRFPYRAPALPTLESRPASRQDDIMDVDSQQLTGSNDTEGVFAFERDNESVVKKNGESLLSQKLRRLDV